MGVPMWHLFRKKTPTVGITDFSDKIAHVAFIMDGNGRWAKKRGLPREAGHIRGAENFRRVIRLCHDLGIRTATFYAFSTENWSRPQREVDGIMNILEEFLEEGLREMPARNVRVIFLGDKTPLRPSLREKAEQIEKMTRDNYYRLNIALNYGGRDEILRACNACIASGKGVVTEEDFRGALFTADSPDPDLVVRTGGDHRISNFLLWQSAYAEYYFTKTLWPDLTKDEILSALRDFCGRHRRFGGLGEGGEKKDATADAASAGE